MKRRVVLLAVALQESSAVGARRPILGGPQGHLRRSDGLAGRTRPRRCAGCSNFRRPISQASAADRRTKRCQLVPLAAQRFDLPYWESSAADPPTISPLRGTARLSSVTAVPHLDRNAAVEV